MTSLAFALGLRAARACARGAGANARHSIGTGIIGGMLGETTLAMLFVPLFFYSSTGWLESAEREVRRQQAARGGARPSGRRRRKRQRGGRLT